MDPCPFVRVLVGNLALKFPVSSSKPSLSRIHPSSTPCFCKIKLKTFPDQMATIPLVQQQQLDHDQSHIQSHESFSASNPISLAACFTFNKTQTDKFVEKQVVSNKHPVLSIDVYSAPDGASCGIPSGKLLGKVYVPLDLRGAESRACVVHNGWVTLGASKKGSSAEMHFTVKVEPDPRFVFQFGGEPECSPQVFQVQGSAKVRFRFWFLPQAVRRGFVMSSTVEGVGKCSKPEVEVGVQHVTCTEDAAAFVALAAAMDLSMDACRLFSQRLRKELRQQFVV
ncbi:uncharacterized protein LOC110819067 [Carica papaya]|uniref:uncharacterized protein LOC110819067 n=1 Tax=Carica papaya TaxID=3649 RepID=UPI000B8D055B|nr:uncharacterized protein LOC110819067 [Carica papaya]